MSAKLVPQETIDGVLACYERGDEITDIEKRYVISRPTLFWILDQNGVTPPRLAPRRSGGATEQLALQDALIHDQQHRIEKLSEIVDAVRTAASGLRVVGGDDPDPTRDAFAKAWVKIAPLIREYDARWPDG